MDYLLHFPALMLRAAILFSKLELSNFFECVVTNETVRHEGEDFIRELENVLVKLYMKKPPGISHSLI